MDDQASSEEQAAKYRYIEKHKSLEVLLGPPTDYPLKYKVEFLNNKCTVKMTLKSFQRVQTKLKTFINENLAYKKFEFKTCVRIKGSKFEEDLKTLYNLDVTIDNEEVDPEGPPTTQIDHELTLVGLTRYVNEAIFEVQRSYLDPESPKYVGVFRSKALPRKLGKEQLQIIK